MRARLVASFLVIVLPAFLLLLVGDYRHLRSLQAAAVAQSSLAAEGARALLVAELDQAAALVRLSTGWPDGSGAPHALDGDLLTALLSGYPEFRNVFLLDSAGQLVSLAPQGQPLALDPAALAQAMAAEASVVSDLMQNPHDNHPSFQVLIPLRTEAGLAGIAGVTLDAAAMGAQLAPLVEGRPLNVALCDRRGWSVYGTLGPEAPWEWRDWSSYPHIQQALAGQAAPAENMVNHLDGSVYVGMALPVPATGWVAYAYQPAPDGLHYLGNRLAIALLSFGLLGIAGFAAATSLARRQTAPLEHLAEHARALGRGQLNERIAVNLHDEFGALANALNGMAQQIEERDRRLRARTAELDAIITQSADGVAIHGAQGELLRLNPAGARILGRSPGRLELPLAEQAEWFRMTTRGRPVEPSELPVAAALRGETRVGQELCVRTEAGEERYVAVSASPLSDSRGHIYGAVSTFRDMTQAHEAQKEKDDFVSLVSHELKTPITSIKGYAQMLLRRAEDEAKDERDLKGLRIINDEVDRMVDLINQLLDVSRLETSRLQLNWDLVDLSALTHDSLDRLQMTTSRHTLRLRASQQPVWVEGDAMRLAQVLGNLIMNAIKYSPGGGPVEISLESQEGRGWVSVRDWGVGIAPEDQPHVFQRFYRGTRKGMASLTGMGLGLYISREIIQRHHGEIAFHSQQGQGTTFLFWLPLAKMGRPAREPRPVHETREGS